MGNHQVYGKYWKRVRLSKAKRHDRILAVMFLDLDGFKAVNDVHGHDAGDAVLKVVADRLPFQLSTGTLKIGVSIGIAIFPKDGTSVSALIKSADTAMYRAKRDKIHYAFAS